MHRAVLADIQVPPSVEPLEEPVFDVALHTGRLQRLQSRAKAAGLDVIIVYADREHTATITWLTGFDPRFEEALLIVPMKGTPVLFTGLENQGAGKAAPLPLDVRLYRPFGLMGQERQGTTPFTDMLAACGIRAGIKVGTIGWKYYGPLETGASPNASHDASRDASRDWIELPAFIVDTLRALVGSSGSVSNAGVLVADPADGLRTENEIDQLARYEFAATHTGAAIHRIVTTAKAGMREFEFARSWQPLGLPLSCHPMLASGSRAWLGLTSPTGKMIERGEAIASGYGVWGALSCRAGWLAAGPEDLPVGVRDYVERLVAPYFLAATDWLAAIDIGVTGGTLDAVVKARLGDPFFGLFLNPGHLIGIDEWLHSPIASGSSVPLRSGMALQLDIIPATGGPYFTSNIEDGVALLDAEGRAAFRDRHKDAWARIERRRAFLADVIGVTLAPSVLPFSDITGWLPPFWLSHGHAMVRR